MNRTVAIFALIFLAAFASMACRGPFSRGVSAYHGGRYPEALDQLMEVEPEHQRFSPPKRARYTLYRGLAHLAVGDTESSERWLAESKALYDWNHHLFDRRDRGRLLSAWSAIGHAPGEWGANVMSARGAW